MILLLLTLALPPQSCRPVHSVRIYARDLAATEPVFAALPPDLPVGFSPVPGMRHVMPVSELRHIAAANGIAQPSSLAPLCFAWPTAVPSKSELLSAMEQTLAGRNPQIEIVDRGRAPAPPGKIVFPLAGLTAVSAAPVIWRGYIEYAPGRRFQLWARVLVRVRENHVVASEALHPGARVGASEVRLEPYDGPPTRDTPFTSIAKTAGLIARFEIAPGTMLSDRLLEAPKAVERGDTVAVLVQLAAARVEAAGIAEQSGAPGATILVRNAESGKKFQAVVQAPDRVLVVPVAPAGLVGVPGKP